MPSASLKARVAAAAIGAVALMSGAAPAASRGHHGAHCRPGLFFRPSLGTCQSHPYGNRTRPSRPVLVRRIRTVIRVRYVTRTIYVHDRPAVRPAPPAARPAPAAPPPAAPILSPAPPAPVVRSTASWAGTLNPHPAWLPQSEVR